MSTANDQRQRILERLARFSMKDVLFIDAVTKYLALSPEHRTLVDDLLRELSRLSESDPSKRT